MGRLTFIMFLVFSLPVGMHHLLADPEHGTGFKFLQSFLTFLVALPTLLTVFSITATLEDRRASCAAAAGSSAGSQRCRWHEPMVLAVAGLSLVMLGLGGFGGLINMSYAMNMMIHNTSWVTAHFHLIFGGAVVIMYFAIAYEMWPRITGNPLHSKRLACWQLWLWFAGMLITTIPWHIAGLMGQPWRIAIFDYSIPMVAKTGWLVIMSAIGGFILLLAAILLIVILLRSHFGERSLISPLSLRAGSEPTAACPGGTERLRDVERDRAGADDCSLWLPHRPVLLPQVPFCPGDRGNKPRPRDDRRTMMARDHGPFKLHDAWSWDRVVDDGWAADSGRIPGVFSILDRAQQNGPALGPWVAICRALGISFDSGPASEAQPPLRSPTRIAWTSATLTQVASGQPEKGAFVALNCTACHGEHGVSQSGLYPTLAGMDPAVIYKQLDDFRSGRRSWGAMNAIAQALLPQDTADVAAYFATLLCNGLPPVQGEALPASGHTLRQGDPAIRLVFAGDPARGIPPCAACHGPGDLKLGAPQLKTQQPAYIERQLAAFAQGFRQNDMNEQMRTIAVQLTPDEMHLIAEFYGEYRAYSRRERGRALALRRSRRELTQMRRLLLPVALALQR